MNIAKPRRVETTQNSPEGSPRVPCQDFLTSYSPKGHQIKRPSLNLEALRLKYHVDHWRKFAAPTYPTVLTTNNYHICRDADTDQYYIEQNRAERPLPKNPMKCNFKNQTSRKEIDTFFNLNDKRFDLINKTPTVLTTVPREKAMNFKGYKGRDRLWKEGDSSTFYKDQKEYTMKKLTHGMVGWDKKGQERTASPMEKYSTSYDYQEAVNALTVKTKPRTRMLTNLTKQQPRDEMLLNTTDMFANVKLENSKEEREAEIQARKTARNKSLSLVNF